MGIGTVIELVTGTLISLGLFTRVAAFIASGEMAVGYWMFHHCIVECALLIGTWSAEGIMASGHVNRVNRPNTWLLRPLLLA
jgi:uncharacterized membrane protein YphA (DoxX/SURF4 family)